jgi:predicted TIM-barrel fold metal-dependent hydrolase
LTGTGTGVTAPPDGRRAPAGPPLFDANVLLGVLPSAVRPPGAPEDVAGLLATMDAYGVGRALATHTLAKWHHPPAGNARLTEEVAGHDRLTACWVVLPAATGEVPPEAAQVAALLAAGARAARLCPVLHRLSLEPWEVDPLLAALAARRVPLLLDFDSTHWSEPRPWAAVERACRAHPHLPVVLLREPQANLRTLLPLLERCPNLVLETSYFQAHDGLALLAERFGAHRLVFGTGTPVWDPALPVTGLAYAGLTPPDLAAVAGGTLQALLDGCLV